MFGAIPNHHEYTFASASSGVQQVYFHTHVILRQTINSLSHSPQKLFEKSSSALTEERQPTVTPLSHYSSHDNHVYSEHRTLVTTGTPHSNEPDAIKRDLVRCSLAMGVPSKTLESKQTTLKNITQKANQFLKAVHFLVPQTLSAKSKNPCWYLNLSTSSAIHEKTLLSTFHAEFGKSVSKDRIHFFARSLFESRHQHHALVCLPSFFIAGFPKSATTSLDAAFRKHPQIIGPQAKEPHWWTRVRNLTLLSVDQDYARLSLYTYLLTFKSLAGSLSSSLGMGLITYDGSQSTLWDSNFFVGHQDYCAMPAVLSRVLPNAKFIVMMRNPITRLYSHYLWSYSFRYGDDIDNWPPNVRNNVTEQFHFEVTKALDHFRKCLQLMTLFECVSEQVTKRFKGQVNAVNHKIIIGLYHVHLMKWFQFYARNQFLLLRMEDLTTNPAKVMSQVTRFLEVAEVPEDETIRWFSKKDNVNQAEATRTEMENRTRTILEKFYHPYNKMLAELVGNDSFLWSG